MRSKHVCRRSHISQLVGSPGTLTSNFTIGQLKSRADNLCRLPSVLDVVALIDPMAEDEKANTACFGLVMLN